MPKMRLMSSMPFALARLISVRLNRPQLALDLAAQAAQSRRGDHALVSAADADRQVVVRAADRGADRGHDVAVGDQLDARAGLADLGDQIVVARPVEHDRGHVVATAAERLGDRLRCSRRPGGAGRSGPRARGPTAIRRMYMSGRVTNAPGSLTAIIDIAPGRPGHDFAPFERIERQVDRAPAGADLLPAASAPSSAAPTTTRPSTGRSLERVLHRARRPPPRRPRDRRGPASGRRQSRRFGHRGRVRCRCKRRRRGSTAGARSSSWLARVFEVTHFTSL